MQEIIRKLRSKELELRAAASTSKSTICNQNDLLLASSLDFVKWLSG